jgi:hypothetical protein
MRHLVLSVLVAGALAIPASAARAGHLEPAKRCNGATAQLAANQGQPARARRLDTLPPGDLQLTVMRFVGSCPERVVLRTGIGAQPAAASRHRSR